MSFFALDVAKRNQLLVAIPVPNVELNWLAISLEPWGKLITKTASHVQNAIPHFPMHHLSTLTESPRAKSVLE